MNETVIGTMARTTAAQFRHVPVVEESRLAGIVSIGDVMKWRLDEPKHESARASLAQAVHVDRIAAMAKATRSHSKRRWRKLLVESHRIRQIRNIAPLEQPFNLRPSNCLAQLQPWAGGGLSRLKRSTRCRSQTAPSAFRVCSKLNFLPAFREPAYVTSRTCCGGLTMSAVERTTDVPRKRGHFRV
jgi:hypothetical protein